MKEEVEVLDVLGYDMRRNVTERDVSSGVLSSDNTRE